MTMAVHFGICPSDKSCKYSYDNARRLPEGFIHSFGRGISLPDCVGGPPGVDPSLKIACELFFRELAEPSGCCGNCGTQLVFAAEIPSCKCQRQYVGKDMDRDFCPDCGHPIDDQVKKDLDRALVIDELLKLVPRLQQHRYLEG